MPTVQLKRSSVASKVPLTTDLALGEIAINTYDGKMFIKKNVTGVETVIDVTANTDLSNTANTSTITIASSRGTSAVVTEANTTAAGVLTAVAQTIGGIKTFAANVSLATVTAGTWNGSVITGTYGGTGVNNGNRTITIGGNVSTANSFTTSGNFALTLTTTADTSVTLPTTGTLATLAGSETLSSKTLSNPIITGTLTANSSVGTAGTVLTSNGAGVYWASVTPAVPTQNTAPISPSPGSMWWDNESGKLFIYYNDGTSSQWVDASPTAGPFINDSTYVYYNGGLSVGIGTTTPAYALDVTGDIRASGDVISNSDIRLKENIVPIQSAMSKVMDLEGVYFNKIGSDKKSVGLIAQNVEAVLPEAVYDDGDYKAVSYGNIVGLLIQAIKEQQTQIQELQAKIGTN